jgi:hypothetical protein
MLEWLAALANDPLRDAHLIPGIGPVYFAIVPLREPLLVKFLDAWQFRTIKIIKIEAFR